MIGWGVGQYDWILVDEAKFDEGVGAHSTQVGLIIVFLVAAVTAVPALAWLYVLVNTERWSTTKPAA